MSDGMQDPSAVPPRRPDPVRAAAAAADAHAGRDDAELVARTRAGDDSAFTALVVRHQEHLYAMALNALGNEADAVEALCESVVEAYRRLDRLRAGCSPAAWLWLHDFRVILRRLQPAARNYTMTGWPERPGRDGARPASREAGEP